MRLELRPAPGGDGSYGIGFPIDREADDLGTLDELTNVDLTGVVNGSIIQYNSSSGFWEVGSDTGLTEIVQDTTPQLGGPLDLNSQVQTGILDVEHTPSAANEVSHALKTDMGSIGGSAQNSIFNLSLQKLGAANNRRTVSQNAMIESGGTDKYLTNTESRWNGTYKTYIVYPSNDDGTITTTNQWARYRHDPSATENYIDLFGTVGMYPTGGSTSHVTIEEDGQITQNVDGTTAPNSMNMITTLDVADTLHNFLTSFNDYGTNAAPDGSTLTHSFKVDGSAGEQFVGRLAFQYDTTVLDNTAELRSTDYTGATQGSIGVNGKESSTDLPFKLPSYTVAGLPTNVSAGAMAYCTNETGGAVPVFYDGSDWRRVTDRAVAS